MDDTLRDRFVCGLRSKHIQKHLLSEDLTIASALEKAQNLETAHHNTQALKGHSPTLVVGKLSDQKSRKWSPGRTRRSSGEPRGRKSPCHRCGGTNHSGQDCDFRDVDCHRCGKKGHLAKVCRSTRVRGKGQTTSRGVKKATTRWVDTDTESPDNEPTEEVLCNVYTLDSKKVNPYKAVLELDGKPVSMEIDTGAAVSIISENTQKSLFPTASLTVPTVRLRTYTSKPIRVVGQMSVEVKYQGYRDRHTLYVVEGKGPSLMGRDWLSQITLDWVSIRAVGCNESKPDVGKLIEKYAKVFQPGLGTMKNIKAQLTLKPEAIPRFHRPRPVPFAIKDKVGQELDRLEEAGVLQRVDHSEWAAPIVPVPKRDGTIRVCGDYKVTVNPSLRIDQYPLPKPSDLMACLSGGKSFTKLDLTAAYQQMQLDPDSAKLVTINTHQGLYQCNRLPFGVASAPAIFQRAMDSILQGIPYVIP